MATESVSIPAPWAGYEAGKLTRAVTDAIVSMEGVADILDAYAEADGGTVGGPSAMMWTLALHLRRIGASLEPVHRAIGGVR